MANVPHEPETIEPPREINPAAALGEVSRAGLRVALSGRDMRLLVFGQVVSQIGDSFLLVAMLIIVRQLTSSPLALAGLAASIGLPTVLFGLFGGVIVDRFDRRWAMLIADIVRGVVVLALLLVRDARGLPVVLAVGFIMGTAGVLFIPARNAVLPMLVAPAGLVAANMLIEATQVLALVIGPALGGLFVARFSPQAAIVFDSLTFFSSGVAIFLMSVRHVNVHTEPFTATELRTALFEGIQFVRSSPLILRLIAAGSASMLALGAVIILGTVQLQEEFQVDPSGIGGLLSVLGLGMVVGGALVALPIAYHHPAPFVGASMVGLALSLSVFPFLPDFRLALVAIFVTGLTLIASRSIIAALVQINTPNDRLGRVESAFNIMLAISYNASLIATGALGIAVNARLIFLAAGALALTSGYIAYQALAKRDRAA
ncbi:MAG: MFS transporter [Anaerolineae bacterium]|nr:MFS transporter [Anaerolineae bacterium]